MGETYEKELPEWVISNWGSNSQKTFGTINKSDFGQK